MTREYFAPIIKYFLYIEILINIVSLNPHGRTTKVTLTFSCFIIVVIENWVSIAMQISTFTSDPVSSRIPTTFDRGLRKITCVLKFIFEAFFQSFIKQIFMSVSMIEFLILLLLIFTFMSTLVWSQAEIIPLQIDLLDASEFAMHFPVIAEMKNYMTKYLLGSLI